jgi:flavin-dependent dehydrogenase
MSGNTDSAAAVSDRMHLRNGSHVAVVGSGPAGSLFSYFILDMSARIGLRIAVDMYEPRQFALPGPQGCNMCGGVISESLVEALAAEGITLPAHVIQRGLDSYVLHMDVGSVRIDTPLRERRIGAVHRGGGPRDVTVPQWLSFDHHLLSCALSKGARLLPIRVDTISRNEQGKPVLKGRDGVTRTYDLLAAAVGVNSPTLGAFEALDIGYRRPHTIKTIIREHRLGREAIGGSMGASMHVFLLNIPRLKFAALIPKGDYVTVCLIGDAIDDSLMDSFEASPEVRQCMPPGWNSARSCQCMPYMNVMGVKRPYADRFVFIGDCGVTRLYKDGIGAAYRTAKAAARTAVFEGISAQAFARRYRPVCRSIAADNRVASLAFMLTGLAQHVKLLRRALLRMAVAEQRNVGRVHRVGGILWDLFSGSAPYIDIVKRMLHPALVWGFIVSTVASLSVEDRGPLGEVPQA